MPENITRRTLVAGTGAAAVAAAVAAAPALADEAPKTPKATGVPANRWESQAAADWRAMPEPVAEDQIADGGTYDIVVVGGGQAGTWTARLAAKEGASVAVLEAKDADSFLYIGGEVACVNSEWALSKGADVIDKRDFMDEWLRRCAGRSNQKLIRNFVDFSGPIMDWSISEINEVDPGYYANPETVNIYDAESDERLVRDPSGYKFYKSTIVHRPYSGGGADWNWGKVVMTHHRDKAVEDGAVWAWNNYAQYLEKDAEDRVTAVVALDQEYGAYVRYTATKGVVLAAGDCLGNRDMVLDINDELRHTAEAYGDLDLAKSSGMMSVRDGMGIKLGVWAGGHVEVGPRTGMNSGQSGTIETDPWGPGFIVLNQRGMRFCNECAGGTEGSGYQSCRQPRGAIISICDANYLDTVYCMPPAHGAVNLTHGVTFNGIDPLVAKMEAADPALDGADDNGIFCADTVEGLLDKLGCYTDEQKAVALSEVEKWNQYCEAGLDDDFAMDPRIMRPIATPPFYAAMGQSDDLYAGLCMTTGLDTDFNGCVLDSDLMPIPGLYAVGNNSGGRYIVNYATPHQRHEPWPVHGRGLPHGLPTRPGPHLIRTQLRQQQAAGQREYQRGTSRKRAAPPLPLLELAGRFLLERPIMSPALAAS